MPDRQHVYQEQKERGFTAVAGVFLILLGIMVFAENFARLTSYLVFLNRWGRSYPRALPWSGADGTILPANLAHRPTAEETRKTLLPCRCMVSFRHITD